LGGAAEAEGEAPVGLVAEAAEPEAAVELGVEADPWSEWGVRAVARAAVQVGRAWVEPRVVAPGPRALPRRSVEQSHSIRRICSPEGRTCDTLGT
jgi:hypothetical protein